MNDFDRLQESQYMPFVESDKFGASEFAGLHELVGQPIPSDYADFLAARPSSGMFELEDTVYIHSKDRLSGRHDGNYAVSMLYAACSDKRYDLREVWLKTDRREFPPYFIQFGDNLFGNLFVVDLRPDTFGQVLFWDHEHEPGETGLHFVALNVRDFIDRLQCDGEGEA
jgi:hypothetical protein